MIEHLDIPEALHRNAPTIAAAGFEHTGQFLIDLATRTVGLKSLKDIDVLDVGCGVRFTMTIINRKIPIKSYTGIEISQPIVTFLQDNVAAHDRRFKFVRWDVHNQMYNPNGIDLAAQAELPVTGSFDLIWLFSVFTHLNPADSIALLRLLRKYIRNDGKLFFSTFIDDELDGFDDRVKGKPLLNAFYGRSYMQSLIEQSGWKVKAIYDKDPSNYIQHYIVCSPA
jgi:SAM-dependent methyltransferase